MRRARFDIDAAALRPYFELERVLHDGVFHAAGLLYGLRFAERHDLPALPPRRADLRRVRREPDRPLGLFVVDLYARDSKRGGAWMNSFVAQSRLLGTRPVVLNTLNIARPADGEPTLLTLDNVRTLFHEFGHALHGLLSDVRYPMLRRHRRCRATSSSTRRRSTRCGWTTRRSWRNYARHHETGEPLPAELVDEAGRGAAVRRGLRHHRVPGRGAARPGMAPAGPRRTG